MAAQTNASWFGSNDDQRVAQYEVQLESERQSKGGWEIIAGAYLSVAESIGVKFIQVASGDTQQSSSFYTIGSAMTSAMFNGKNITTSPFRFSGFRIGFNVGVSTGPPSKYKTKKNKAGKM